MVERDKSLVQCRIVTMPQDREATSSAPGPVPFLVAMLVADLAIRDHQTNKVSLIGIFENIRAPSFPCRHEALTVYAKVTDAQGTYDFRLEVIHLDKARRIAEVPIKGEAAHRLGIGEIVVTIGGLVFPGPGLYEFRLSANGRYVGSKTVRMEKEQLPTGGES